MSITENICEADDCLSTGMLDDNGKRYLIKGLCPKHYVRQRKYGNINFNKYEKEGLSLHPLYQTWAGMIQRCENTSHPKYYTYGALGVVVCNRWRKSFKTFLSDMGEKPSSKHSIDRINVYGNYEPGNCRWATALEQANNKRK